MEALEILKFNAPVLIQKAVDMAADGNERVLCALVNKICPDKLDLGEGANALQIIVELVRATRGDKNQTT